MSGSAALFLTFFFLLSIMSAAACYFVGKLEPWHGSAGHDEEVTSSFGTVLKKEQVTTVKTVVTLLH